MNEGAESDYCVRVNSRRLPVFTTILAPLALVAFAQTNATPTPSVVHVSIRSALDIGVQSVLTRGIREAKEAKCGLVVELNTPGGSLELMWALSEMIDHASRDGVPTTAWINNRALSAGALLAIACDRVYIASTGVIGASTPVEAKANGDVGEIEDPDMRAKIVSAVSKDFKSFAETHKRDGMLAMAMVDRDLEVRQVKIDGVLKLISGKQWDDAREQGQAPELVRTIVQRGKLLSLSADEAVEFGFADGVADKLTDVLEKLGLRDANVVAIDRARSDEVATWLEQFRYVLLVAAIVAAYLEFKAPGFGVFGVISLVCFALFLFGRYMVGIADWWEIGAISVGLILVAVEIFAAPGVLWPGLTGAVLVLAGLVSIASGPVFNWSYALDRQRLFDEGFRVTFGIAGAVVVGLVIGRFLPKTPGVRRMVLAPVAGGHTGGAVSVQVELGESRPSLGATGVAVTDLRPVGKVALEAHGSREFEARASGAAIDRGAEIRVVAIAAGRLVVEVTRERNV